MKLDREQNKIFIDFIDLYRDIVRDKKYKFVATHLADGTTLIGHPLKSKNEMRISKIDFEALCRNELFDGYYIDSPNHKQFIIPLEAIEYYEKLKNEKLIPLQKVEDETLDYISSDIFVSRYPKAYAKWQMAEKLFLKEIDNSNLSTIGHLCKESLQEFSDELLYHKSLKNEYPKSSTVAKIRHMLNSININSSSKSKFLDAILNY